jgi:hypothetical protein
MMPNKTLTAATAAALAALALTSCSGGSGGAGAAAGGPNTKQAAAAVSGALQSMQEKSKKACAAVKQEDVAAVLKTAATEVTNPEECDYGSGAMTVGLFLDDASLKYYGDQTSNVTSSGSGSLPVGDKGVWFQPVPGHTLPVVVSHKGSVTCIVQLSADPPDTTATFSGKAPIYTIEPADAATYAAKLGTLCSDAFSAVA